MERIIDYVVIFLTRSRNVRWLVETHLFVFIKLKFIKLKSYISSQQSHQSIVFYNNKEWYFDI